MTTSTLTRHDDQPGAEVLRPWVRLLGLGFHPDTRGTDYVNADGTPTLNERQAQAYETDIEAAFGLCDPYEVGMALWAEMGLTDDAG